MTMTDCTQNSELIEQVIKIVREASHIMLNRELEVTQKGNASNYVTSADLKVQQYLAQKLPALLPGSLFIGEESETNPSAGKNLWVVDPIDGTSNFIRDLGCSAISVGLVRNGEPYLGVVYQPYRDEMFWAETGKGAFLNGRRIHVSDRDYAHGHLCSAMSLYNKSLAKPCFRIIERVYNEADDLRRLGTAAVELVYLAAGRVELYFEMRLFPWDIAGAIPIVREAGGQIACLFHEGMPLDEPCPVVAANSRESFKKLMTIVQEEIPEPLY